MTLLDGTQTSNSSEAWRHECEARSLLRVPKPLRMKILGLVNDKRGWQARQALEKTIIEIWTDNQARSLAKLSDEARPARIAEMEGKHKDHIMRRILDRLDVVMETAAA